jgi:hypothetical protein
MAKPLSLALDGKLMVGSALRAAEADLVLDRFEAIITPKDVRVTARKSKWLVLSDSYDRSFPFVGSKVERLDEGRSTGKAAFGAVAGAVLAGPLGLLAGAALGGRKRHIVSIEHNGAQVMLEVSPSELQTLIARAGLTA